jgi:hypothetical protein
MELTKRLMNIVTHLIHDICAVYLLIHPYD